MVSMFLVSHDLACGVALLVPAIIFGGTLFGGALRQLSRDSKQATAEAHGVAGEVLNNVRTVKSFAAEDYEEQRFAELTGRCRSLSITLGVGIGAFAGLTHMFTNGLVLSVLYFGGQMMSKNELSPGDLMAFLVSAQTIQRSFSHMSVLLGTAMRGADAGARVFQYMKMKPDAVTNRGICPASIEGVVELRNISFSYPTRPEQQILDGLTLTIPAGKTVALCGPSGAGKSTIAGLIERFYDPDGGGVYIDGYPLKELDTTWIRREIGSVLIRCSDSTRFPRLLTLRRISVKRHPPCAGISTKNLCSFRALSGKTLPTGVRMPPRRRSSSQRVVQTRILLSAIFQKGAALLFPRLLRRRFLLHPFSAVYSKKP
jgi:ATP-binding cassette subfamily B (MDR/TAP) protein 8